MIRQFVSSRVCLKCRGCCRFFESDTVWSPHLLNEEINSLLKKQVPPALISCQKKIRLEPNTNQHNACGEAGFICSFFIAQDNKCKIYASRPFECRLYPFLLNRKAKKVFLAADLNCHFVKQMSKNKALKNYIKYLAAFFNAPEGLSLLKDNPHIIQEYPGVLDVRELNFSL